MYKSRLQDQSVGHLEFQMGKDSLTSISKLNQSTTTAVSCGQTSWSSSWPSHRLQWLPSLEVVTPAALEKGQEQ